MKAAGPIRTLPSYPHMPLNDDASGMLHDLLCVRSDILNAGFDALKGRGAVVYHRSFGPPGDRRGWFDLQSRATLFAICRGQDRVTRSDVQDAYIVLVEAYSRASRAVDCAEGDQP